MQPGTAYRARPPQLACAHCARTARSARNVSSVTESAHPYAARARPRSALPRRWRLVRHAPGGGAPLRRPRGLLHRLRSRLHALQCARFAAPRPRRALRCSKRLLRLATARVSVQPRRLRAAEAGKRGQVPVLRKRSSAACAACYPADARCAAQSLRRRRGGGRRSCTRPRIRRCSRCCRKRATPTSTAQGEPAAATSGCAATYACHACSVPARLRRCVAVLKEAASSQSAAFRPEVVREKAVTAAPPERVSRQLRGRQRAPRLV